MRKETQEEYTKRYEEMVYLEIAAKQVIEEELTVVPSHILDTFDKWMFREGKYASNDGWFWELKTRKEQINWIALALLMAATLAYENDVP